MSIPIQSDQQNTINVAINLDRLQSLETDKGESKHSNIGERKKRPEDLVNSLAAIAAVAWANQPAEIRTLVENKIGLSIKLDALTTDQNPQKKGQEISDARSAITSFFNGAEIKKTSSLSVFSPESPMENHKTAEKLNPDETARLSENDSDTLTLQSVGTKPERLNSNFIDASRAASVNSVGEKIKLESLSAVTSNLNPASKINDLAQSGVQSGQQDLVVDESQNDIGSQPNIIETVSDGGRSRQLEFSHINKNKKDEDIENNAEPVVASPLNTNADNIVVTVPDQTFRGATPNRSVENARAELAAQVGRSEGLQFKFKSWGAGNNSVQITGSTKMGYKAQASNSEVGSILEAHLPDDESLLLKISSTDHAVSSPKVQGVQQRSNQVDPADE